MKTKLLALMLLGGGSLFAETHFSFGIGIGGYAPGYYYAPPPPPVVVAPVYPEPGYVWSGGYWVRRPYYYSAPRYDYRYYGGYWRRGRDWDRDRDWDRRRGWDRDEGRGRGYGRR